MDRAQPPRPRKSRRASRRHRGRHIQPSPHRRLGQHDMDPHSRPPVARRTQRNHRSRRHRRLLQRARRKTLRGRYFTESEDKTKPHVAIINRSFERIYFPGEDPLAHQLSHLGQLLSRFKSSASSKTSRKANSIRRIFRPSTFLSIKMPTPASCSPSEHRRTKPQSSPLSPPPSTTSIPKSSPFRAQR